MNDVLSRFLVVMEDEVDAYWCFTLFMDSIFNDFLEDGMIKKLCKYIEDWYGVMSVVR